MPDTTHAEFIQGLRELADFYEAHPEVKLPHAAQLSIFSWDKDQAVADAVRCAHAFGHAEKSYSSDYFRMVRKFPGGVSLEFCTDRQTVCTPVVVGTKVEPAHTIPAQEERFIPERVVEQIEWRCQSLLAAAPQAMQTSPARGEIQEAEYVDDVPF